MQMQTRCECKELIDKEMCDKRFIWNSSNCECECDKSCDVREYLDCKNGKCRKIEKGQLINQLKNVVKILIRRNYIQQSCTQIK